MGELCEEFQSGKNIKAEDIKENGAYPVYGGNGLRGYSDTYNHDGVYALVGRQGALCGNMNISFGKAYFTEHAVAVKANISSDTEFLFYLLGKMNLGQYSSQSAQPGLAVNKLIKLTTFVPNRYEQKKIKELYVFLDSAIALHQRKLNLLKQLKQSYLNALFPQNDETIPVLRFPAFSDSWEDHKFSDIVIRVSVQSNDSNLPKVEFEDIVSGEGRLNKDISRKFDSRKGTVFEPRFILYGKLRPYLKNWLFPNFKGIALGDFWVFEPNNSSSIFDYYLIQSDKYQTAANLSSGTKMPRSDWKIVSETVFNIPNCIEEQEKIGTFFKQLDNAITLRQCKLEKLIELKNVLLGKMFL